MEIEFTTRVFKEGTTFVGQALELDVARCGINKSSPESIRQSKCPYSEME